MKPPDALQLIKFIYFELILSDAVWEDLKIWITATERDNDRPELAFLYRTCLSLHIDRIRSIKQHMTNHYNQALLNLLEDDSGNITEFSDSEDEVKAVSR